MRICRIGLGVFLALVSWSASCAFQLAPLAPSVDSLTNARKLMGEEQFAKADALLRPIIDAQPKAPEPRYLLAYALLREDKAAESLQEYTRAAALRAPAAADLRNVALDYVLLHDLADADRWLTRALAMDDRDADTWYAMGRLRYTQGRYPDALKCFEKTLELHPRSVKGENNLGLTYEALNRDELALAAYRSAIAWQQDDPRPSEQPLLNLAILLLHHNQAAEAEQLLTKAAKIAPEEPRIYENLGQVYLRESRYTEAVREFSEAVQLDPKNPRYHFLLGQAYRRAGDIARARQELARSATLNGAHSTSLQQ